MLVRVFVFGKVTLRVPSGARGPLRGTRVQLRDVGLLVLVCSEALSIPTSRRLGGFMANVHSPPFTCRLGFVSAVRPRRRPDRPAVARDGFLARCVTWNCLLDSGVVLPSSHSSDRVFPFSVASGEQESGPDTACEVSAILIHTAQLT